MTKGEQNSGHPAKPSARRRLELLLGELYSEDVAQRLAQELIERLPARASVGSTPVNRSLLITYGDSFRSQGERPTRKAISRIQPRAYVGLGVSISRL